MNTFNRGLGDAFVDALNKEYDKDGWWRAFVDDKDVFLAIRENYVNAYYRGCSLLRLSWEAGAFVGEVHYKYLLRPSASNEYVKVVDGRAKLDNAKSRFLDDIGEIDSLKKAATSYVGAEKAGVHDILSANNNILDVEIAFGKDESDTGAPRLDFAAIRKSGEEAKIVFFEAKHFNNHNALRKSGDAKPEVVKQIATYRSKLRDNRDAIAKSYCRVCCNLRSLRGVAERHAERHAMLESISGQQKLTVDENPVLIVFGFDGDQKVGKHWERHRQKLETELEGRVRFKGNSSEFKSGIST